MTHSTPPPITKYAHVEDEMDRLSQFTPRAEPGNDHSDNDNDHDNDHPDNHQDEPHN